MNDNNTRFDQNEKKWKSDGNFNTPTASPVQKGTIHPIQYVDGDVVFENSIAKGPKAKDT